MPNSRPQRLFGGAALTCVAALCVCTIASNLYGNGSHGSDADPFAARFGAATHAEDVAARGDKLVSSVAARLAAANSPALSDA
jgi:hypothetical protein